MPLNQISFFMFVKENIGLLTCSTIPVVIDRSTNLSRWFKEQETDEKKGKGKKGKREKRKGNTCNSSASHLDCSNSRTRPGWPVGHASVKTAGNIVHRSAAHSSGRYFPRRIQPVGGQRQRPVPPKSFSSDHIGAFFGADSLALFVRKDVLFVCVWVSRKGENRRRLSSWLMERNQWTKGEREDSSFFIKRKRYSKLWKKSKKNVANPTSCFATNVVDALISGPRNRREEGRSSWRRIEWGEARLSLEKEKDETLWVWVDLQEPNSWWGHRQFCSCLQN